jgi:hypothetical protein
VVYCITPQFFSPSVFPDNSVDVLADVFFLGLLRGLVFNVAGNVFPITVTISKKGKK